MRVRFAISAALIGLPLGLAACGNEGGGLGQTRPPVNYATLSAQRSALQANWAGQSATVPTTLPASGTASFAGVMSLDAQTAAGNLSMAAELAVDADFATSTISGRADGFRDEFGVNFQGAVTLTNGFIDRRADPATDPTVLADVNGTLTGGGDAFSISATMNGAFLGAGAQAVTGTINGTAASSFGSGYLTGDIIAQR